MKDFLEWTWNLYCNVFSVKSQQMFVTKYLCFEVFTPGI